MELLTFVVRLFYFCAPSIVPWNISSKHSTRCRLSRNTAPKFSALRSWSLSCRYSLTDAGEVSVVPTLYFSASTSKLKRFTEFCSDSERSDGVSEAKRSPTPNSDFVIGIPLFSLSPTVSLTFKSKSICSSSPKGEIRETICPCRTWSVPSGSRVVSTPKILSSVSNCALRSRSDLVFSWLFLLCSNGDCRPGYLSRLGIFSHYSKRCQG